ncbi:MAG: glycosyltransferase family 2 protein [Eubacteriales bacterium]|nr:glycosyltransferase family 2 protein [Eubacteriales bacterium]
MKNIVFSKHSNERDRKFSVRTDIWIDEKGTKTVEKTACYPEGKNHVAQTCGWYEKLQKQFAPFEICVNKVKEISDGSVCLEYLEGGVTLEKQLYDLVQKGEKDRAFQIMEDFLTVLRRCATQDFEYTEGFKKVFGDIRFMGELKCMPVTDIDMVLENIVLTQDGNVRTLIDYEWTFDFPIPVNFIIYRIWRYFIYRNFPQQSETLVKHCAEEEIDVAQIRAYQEMEKAFQAYVTGSHVPLREMFAGISPGSISLAQLGIGKEKQQGNSFKSTLSLWSEQGEMIWSIAAQLTADETGRFEVEFDLSGGEKVLKGQHKLRWDPLEGQLCRIRIDQLSAQTPLKMSAINGFCEGTEDVFWTRDPAYAVSGAFQKIKKIVIRGWLQTVTMEELLPEFVQIRRQRDAYFEELENVRGQLQAIRGTKGFRAMEKARSVRNYFSVRINGQVAHLKRTLDKNTYHKWYLQHAKTEEELAAQRKSRPQYCPKISILVPTYKTPVKFLKEMLDSVVAQTYGNWELCIADGGSGREVTDILDGYAAADERIKYVVLKENTGISGNTNGAAAMATGEYIALLDHDDLLSPDALFEVVYAMQETMPDVLYTDEDKVDTEGEEYFSPHLKPDFSPDLLRSHNYITHLFVLKKALFDELGGFRSEFDGAQDYDLILRSVERANEVRHVPKILYHWRMHRNSTAQNPESKMYAYEAGKKAVEEHLKRMGLKGSVEMTEMHAMYHVTYDTPENPLVSVIIPNKDHTDDLDKCIRSIMEKSSYRNLEIVVVENNSRQDQTWDYYKKIQSEFPQVRVEIWDREFNYSAINNFGVSKAKGDYLLLLNNDTELISPDGIGEMLGYCMRKDVGAVGAKLLFEDDTVQHVGIVLGFGGFAGHVFSGFEKDNPAYMARAKITGNFSAVTAACMMVRSEVYRQVEGFSEEFAVALNDVDFCMKLRSEGYLIVMHPFALWHHYESKSRGYEDTPEKQERFQREVERFRDYWGETVDAGDPYYNPNFSVKAAPFTLV